MCGCLLHRPRGWRHRGPRSRPCGSLRQIGSPGHNRADQVAVGREDLAQRRDLGLQIILLDDPAGARRARSAHPLLTTAPRTSISAISTSNARPPSSTGRLSASSARRCDRTRKRPNSTAVGASSAGDMVIDRQSDLRGFQGFSGVSASDGMLDAWRKPPPIATKSSTPRDQEQHGRSGPPPIRQRPSKRSRSALPQTISPCTSRTCISSIRTRSPTAGVVIAAAVGRPTVAGRGRDPRATTLRQPKRFRPAGEKQSGSLARSVRKPILQPVRFIRFTPVATSIRPCGDRILICPRPRRRQSSSR